MQCNYTEPRNVVYFFFRFDASEQCVIAFTSNNEQFHHKTEANPNIRNPKYRQNWKIQNWLEIELYIWSPIFVSPNVFFIRNSHFACVDFSSGPSIETFLVIKIEAHSTPDFPFEKMIKRIIFENMKCNR